MKCGGESQDEKDGKEQDTMQELHLAKRHDSLFRKDGGDKRGDYARSSAKRCETISGKRRSDTRCAQVLCYHARSSEAPGDKPESGQTWTKIPDDFLTTNSVLLVPLTRPECLRAFSIPQKARREDACGLLFSPNKL